MTSSVGIVLVSHSAALARGVRELAEQIGSDAVPVVAAGGTEEGGIGTSYSLVLEAMEQADRGAGVVVLPDLGSSVLITRTVLEDHPRPDARIVDAPFVEGTIAAVVAAASGAALDTVVNAAQEARHAVKF